MTRKRATLTAGMPKAVTLSAADSLAHAAMCYLRLVPHRVPQPLPRGPATSAISTEFLRTMLGTNSSQPRSTHTQPHPWACARTDDHTLAPPLRFANTVDSDATETPSSCPRATALRPYKIHSFDRVTWLSTVQ